MPADWYNLAQKKVSVLAENTTPAPTQDQPNVVQNKLSPQWEEASLIEFMNYGRAIRDFFDRPYQSDTMSFLETTSFWKLTLQTDLTKRAVAMIGPLMEWNSATPKEKEWLTTNVWPTVIYDPYSDDLRIADYAQEIYDFIMQHTEMFEHPFFAKNQHGNSNWTLAQTAQTMQELISINRTLKEGEGEEKAALISSLGKMFKRDPQQILFMLDGVSLNSPELEPVINESLAAVPDKLADPKGLGGVIDRWWVAHALQIATMETPFVSYLNGYLDEIMYEYIFGETIANWPILDTYVNISGISVSEEKLLELFKKCGGEENIRLAIRYSMRKMIATLYAAEANQDQIDEIQKATLSVLKKIAEATGHPHLVQEIGFFSLSFTNSPSGKQYLIPAELTRVLAGLGGNMGNEEVQTFKQWFGQTDLQGIMATVAQMVGFVMAEYPNKVNKALLNNRLANLSAIQHWTTKTTGISIDFTVDNLLAYKSGVYVILSYHKAKANHKSTNAHRKLELEMFGKPIEKIMEGGIAELDFTETEPPKGVTENPDVMTEEGLLPPKVCPNCGSDNLQVTENVFANQNAKCLDCGWPYQNTKKIVEEIPTSCPACGCPNLDKVESVIKDIVYVSCQQCKWKAQTKPSKMNTTSFA